MRWRFIEIPLMLLSKCLFFFVEYLPVLCSLEMSAGHSQRAISISTHLLINLSNDNEQTFVAKLQVNSRRCVYILCVFFVLDFRRKSDQSTYFSLHIFHSIVRIFFILNADRFVSFRIIFLISILCFDLLH